MLKKIPLFLRRVKRILFRSYTDKKEVDRLKRFEGTEDVFTNYFENRHWKGGGDETVSGAASTIQYTENIRREIPLLIKKLDVRTLLDAPCGDYNWFRMIDRAPDVHYIGADIVKPMIESNRKHYANHNTEFICLDLIKGPLPDADLWILRDCLIHLCDDDVFSILDNFLQSNIRYLLTTTHTECMRNRNIPTGSWRQINLELPPFSFCPAINYIDDDVEGTGIRKLGLWQRGELSDCLISNKALQRARKAHAVQL